MEPTDGEDARSPEFEPHDAPPSRPPPPPAPPPPPPPPTAPAPAASDENARARRTVQVRWVVLALVAVLVLVGVGVGGYLIGKSRPAPLPAGVSTVDDLSKSCKLVIETARQLSDADQRYLRANENSPEADAAFDDLDAAESALVPQLKQCPP